MRNRLLPGPLLLPKSPEQRISRAAPQPPPILPQFLSQSQGRGDADVNRKQLRPSGFTQTLQGAAAALRVRTQGESWTPRAKQKDTVIVGEAITQKVPLPSLPDSSPPSPGAHKSQNSTEVWLQQKEMAEGSRAPVDEQGSPVSRSGFCCGGTSLSPQQPMLTHACYCFLGGTAVVDLHPTFFSFPLNSQNFMKDCLGLTKAATF